jgi:hypothetical protein
MERETIENILNFLQNNEGKKLPKRWFDSLEKFKLVKKLENHPDHTQYRDENSLGLSRTNITKLPNDLYVDDYLNLDDCKKLTKLPYKLYVGGYFSILRTNIGELPDNLHVGSNFYIKYTPLADKYTDEEIYKIVTSTGGEIVGKIIR